MAPYYITIKYSMNASQMCNLLTNGGTISLPMTLCARTSLWLYTIWNGWYTYRPQYTLACVSVDLIMVGVVATWTYEYVTQHVYLRDEEHDQARMWYGSDDNGHIISSELVYIQPVD